MDARRDWCSGNGRRERLEKGLEKGIAKGLEEGMQIGEERGRVEIVENMLSKRVDIKLIAEFTGLRTEEIEEIEARKRKMNKLNR